MKKTSVKIKELVNKLRGDIVRGYLQAGDSIPTFRQLMSDFNLSQGSVTRGINILCEQGLIYKKSGSGLYVNEFNDKKNKTSAYHITVFVNQAKVHFRDNDTMIANIYLGLQDAAECDLSLINTETNDLPEKKFLAANKNSDAIILIGEYDDRRPDLDFQVPAVGIFMDDDYNGSLSILGLDSFAAAREATKYFMERGINSVHVISSMLPAFYSRAKVFETYWRQTGNSIVFSPGDAVVDFKKECGYFFSSDTICQLHCHEFLQQTGKDLYQFANIFSIDGKRDLSGCEKLYYKFPSYGIDWKQLGKYAYEECIYRVKNVATPGRKILLSGRLKI